MRWWVVPILALTFGCTSTEVSVEPEPVLAESVPLALAKNVSAGLNVSINVFESSNVSASTIYVATKQVREVEKRYFPYVLKRVLDKSGYWGAVRVLPRHDPSAEVTVSGKILESSGTKLSLHISVVDATGTVWLDQVYTDHTDDIDYAADPEFQNDAFSDLYHRLANDMAARLAEVNVESLSNAALVVYGAELSPETFTRYLVNGESGRYAGALPARNDPIFQNVLRIREAEYLFADSVDEHYQQLFRSVGPTYAWWRYYSYELIEGNRRLARIDATRGATKGSWYAKERVYKTFKEAKMNQDALRELGDSFDRETSATTAELSGRVIELKGTLEHQYETWRRLLHAMLED